MDATNPRPVLPDDVRWVEAFLNAGPLVRVTPVELTELVRRLEKMDLRAGTVLYHAGQRPEGVWIIRSGGVALYDSAGPNRALVRVLRAGGVVGDLYLILAIDPPLSARTTDETQCLYLSAASFEHLLRTYPAVSAAWLSNFARRLADNHTRVLEVLGRSLPERVARVLVQESVDHHFGLPQETLAQMLGAQRSSVNRTLRALQEEGLVELSYADIRLVDFQSLKAIADGRRALRGKGSSG